MAKFEDLPNQITSLETEWDGHSGMEVEDYISRNIEELDNNVIESGIYEDETLKLYKKDGSSVDVHITVQEPTYSYGIYIYGLRVDGGNPILRGQGLQTIQYVDSKKYELGIAMYATADTSIRQDRVGPFSVRVKYGSSNTYTYSVNNISYTYFNLDDSGKVSGLNIPEEENINDVVKWIDVKDIFGFSQENAYISATIVNDKETANVGVLTDTFTTPITTQVISLAYNGDIVVNSNVATFTLTGANSTGYMLEAYNQSGKITIDTGQTNLNCPLNPGLNQLIVRAVNKTNSDIKTEWVYVDLISTIDCNQTVIAINGVTEGIKNNSIATLYNLTVYSPNEEDVNITTYLSQYDPGSGIVNPDESDQLKQQTITSLNYNSDHVYSESYYKYIENKNSAESNRYLMVKFNNNFYSFNELEELSSQLVSTLSYFKVMPISAVNYNYCYYDTGVLHSFDQLTAYINDVFITNTYSEAIGKPANVSDTLEVSDGWYEDKGVVYFKVSAQDDPVITLNDLNLGNNFTLELGFRTYNISDESKPVLTLGNMQLRPTQFCWNVEEGVPNGDATFNARNSIFQENVKTHLTVTVQRNFTIQKGETYYPDYLGSFQSTFDTNMTSSTYNDRNRFNLVRVFINDVIDREFIITDDELENLKTSQLVVNPTTADIDFYLVRIYNQTALNFDQVQQNYISFLTNDVSIPDDDPKTEFYDKNDILGSDGEISFTKSYKKHNTLVLVFPKDPVNPDRTDYVPTRAWGGKDNADPTPNDNLACTMFLNYADESVNRTYGGRISGIRTRGQGTSAMRYFIWNVATHMSKAKSYVKREDGTIDTSQTEDVNGLFVPYSNLDPDTNKFTGDSGKVKKGYYMPPYSGQPNEKDCKGETIKVKKAVGKVNYASSMQSHVMGFCKLYNDFYQSQRGALSTGGRKSKQQEPFLYFYWYANTYDVSEIELADLLAADAGTSLLGGKLKFMGFQTWGGAKADDDTFGYDDDLTPGYILLEGGENGDVSVNFRCPWQALQRNPVSWSDISNPSLAPNQTLQDVPVISYQDSLNKPWENLWISGDESIIYDPNTADVTGAWDVNYGLEEVEDELTGASLGFRMNVGTDDTPNNYLRQSMKTWREFYDFVYTHDYNIIETNSGDTSTWKDTNHKYVCTSSSCDASVTHKANDVYRYNKLSGKWIPAGVEYDTIANQWKAFNLVSDVGNSSVNTIARAKAYLKQEFTTIAWNSADPKNSGPLDAVDGAIHQAMIRFISGTDNRAKNTYFRITGPLLTEVESEEPEGDSTFEPPSDYAENPRKYHYVGFMQDDVDTILATDNNGLQTKQYNLLEPSYRESDSQYWGDSGSNAFFYMFDQCYETEINNWVSRIIDYAFPNPNINNTSNKFYQYFFNTQDSLPAIAYNHTAKIYYELGQLVLNVGAIENFSSNDQQPIQQSHGSCINSEKNYMNKRLVFLGTQTKNSTIAGVGNLSVNPGSGTGGAVKPVKIKVDFSPYQDMYPLYRYTGVDYLYDNGQTSDPIAIRYLTEAGKDYSMIINRTADSVNNNISLINYYKKLTLTGLESSSLGTVAYDRAVEFKIDNDLAGNDYAESNFTDSSIPTFPVVEDFTLANMELPDTFDASQFAKLRKLNLSGTTTKYVIFPNSGRLETVILPQTIETFRIYNNPGLHPTIDQDGTREGIIFEGLDNLTTVEINCNNAGNFDISGFCEQLIECNSLQSVTLKNANIRITEEALQKLVMTNTCVLTGDIYIVDEPGSGTLKDISFDTKQRLVNIFGDISSPSSALRIHFQSSQITDFTCATEVAVYYQAGESGTIVRQNLFDITVPVGNDVEIKQGANPFNPSINGYLDITYSMSGVSSDVATIDQTGAITLKKESSSTATVTISMKVANNPSAIKKTVTVKFTWQAPELGDFAYADGTFTSSYDATKTLVGLVYAKNVKTETTGTVFIIGKEFTDSDKSYYLGYSADGNEGSSESILQQLYQVQAYLNNVSIQNYEVVSNVATPQLISNINVTTYTTSVNDSFSGDTDTQAYINHVNTKLLPTLYTNNAVCRQYIQRTQESGGSWTYYIDNIRDLNNLCGAIQTIWTNASSTDIMSCLLYPYFYSMHVYEPSVKETETLNSQYKKGNWYAPSVAEFSRIIYYRGYSVSGNNFNTGDLVRQPISTSVSKGSTTLTTPIFSMAYSRAGNNFPAVWNSVVGSGDNAGVNNITTSINSSAANNYSYQRTSEYDSSTSGYTYKNEWITGSYTDPSYWNTTQYRNAWRLTKHQGIPFTKFDYSKDD